MGRIPPSPYCATTMENMPSNGIERGRRHRRSERRRRRGGCGPGRRCRGASARAAADLPDAGLVGADESPDPTRIGAGRRTGRGCLGHTPGLARTQGLRVADRVSPQPEARRRSWRARRSATTSRPRAVARGSGLRRYPSLIPSSPDSGAGSGRWRRACRLRCGPSCDRHRG